MFGNEHYAAWSELETTMRTGKAGFDVHYGEPVFDYFRKHPESEKLFGEAFADAYQEQTRRTAGLHKK